MSMEATNAATWLTDQVTKLGSGVTIEVVVIGETGVICNAGDVDPLPSSLLGERRSRSRSRRPSFGGDGPDRSRGLVSFNPRLGLGTTGEMVTDGMRLSGD